MQEFILPKNTTLANNEFLRLTQYIWNDVMAVMAQNTESISIGEHQVRINRLKYKTFVRDYYEGKFCCSCCGIQPSHAVVFGTTQSAEKFINFFALDRGKEILLTHDHTIARALGGKNELDNTTTMCEHCNAQKSVFESIYGNHRLDIIKNYLNNSLGHSVSLSKLEQLAKNFDISSLNPKFLSGAMYLLFVFNNENSFDSAVSLLSQRLGMSNKEYISHCNLMGEQHMRSHIPVVFPFARIFYPKLSAWGAQFLRLEISRRLIITWPSTFECAADFPVYYDELFQSVLVEERNGLGKVFTAKDMQKMLYKNPALWDCETLVFGTTPVEFSKDARNCLKNTLDPDLVIAVRKNIRRTLIPGYITDNKFNPISWDELNTHCIKIAPRFLKDEPRLINLNGLSYAQAKDHPTYLELLVELACFKQQTSINHLIKHTKAKTDHHLLSLLQSHHPHLPAKAAEAVASCGWTVGDFLIQWERKNESEKKAQAKRERKQANSKLKRHFAQNDEKYIRSKSKRALY